MSTRLMAVLAALLLAGCGRPVQTAEPTRVRQTVATSVVAPPSRTPVLATPSPTPLSVVPEPSGDVLAVLYEAPPMTGRGLGIVEQQAPAVEAAPTYLEIVQQQAPHSPRGDGQPGPTGGEWVAVPTLAPAQAEVIRQQVPHKVR